MAFAKPAPEAIGFDAHPSAKRPLKLEGIKDAVLTDRRSVRGKTRSNINVARYIEIFF